LDADEQSGRASRQSSGLTRNFRRKFLMGLVAILPIGLTIFVFWFLVTRFGNLLVRLFAKIPYLNQLPEVAVGAIGFVAVVIGIYLVGVLTTSILGRWMVQLGELLLSRVPLVRTVYTSSKQLVETLFIDRSAFRKVVMVEFPKKGTYAMGFITTYDAWIEEPSGVRTLPVFVPTTPNPTSGYLLLVPEHELVQTDLTVEWAMKVIISGGIVSPQVRVINASTGKDRQDS
jgi:uncharacterized membrane protein